MLGVDTIAGQCYSLLLNTVHKVLIERHNNQYKDPRSHVASGVIMLVVLAFSKDWFPVA